jgi:hypothetical protein
MQVEQLIIRAGKKSLLPRGIMRMDGYGVNTLVQPGGNMQAVLFAASPGKTTCSPATVSAEGRQFNGAPSPAPNWRGNCGTQY